MATRKSASKNPNETTGLDTPEGEVATWWSQLPHDLEHSWMHKSEGAGGTTHEMKTFVLKPGENAVPVEYVDALRKAWAPRFDSRLIGDGKPSPFVMKRIANGSPADKTIIDFLNCKHVDSIRAPHGTRVLESRR